MINYDKMTVREMLFIYVTEDNQDIINNIGKLLEQYPFINKD